MDWATWIETQSTAKQRKVAKKMKTLKQICIERKARKGVATGVTKDGAYWEALRIKIDRDGGDGIGQSAPDIKYYLIVRHYRSGDIRAYLTRETWHQNDGKTVSKTRADNLLDCQTIEDIQQAVKGHTIKSNYSDNDHQCRIYDWHLEHELIPGLLEMVLQVAAPDEV